jgi:hypothetical protein
MKRLEMIVAIIGILLAVVAVVDTRSLAIWQEFSPGPAFMPIWVSAFCGILGVLMFLQARARADDEPVDWPDRAGGTRVILASICLWVFVLALNTLGIVLGGFIFLLVMLCGVMRQRFFYSFIVSTVTVGMIYGIFVSWLQLSLPLGVLSSIL